MEMKRKRINYVMYALLVLSLVLLVYSGFSIFSMTQKISEEKHAYKTIVTGSTNNGDVLIELTPVGITGNVFAVQIAANTHSVDLSQFDLANQTSIDTNGKTAKPVSAPSLQGHHASGTLQFNVEPTDRFSITITGIPTVEERRYTWP